MLGICHKNPKSKATKIGPPNWAKQRKGGVGPKSNLLDCGQ